MMRRQMGPYIGMGIGLALAVPIIVFSIKFVNGLSPEAMIAIGVAVFVLVLVLSVMLAMGLVQALTARAGATRHDAAGGLRQTIHHHYPTEQPSTPLPTLPPMGQQQYLPPGAFDRQSGGRRADWLADWPAPAGHEHESPDRSVTLE